MSKRGEQVGRNLDRLEAEWEATHPGETMGPVVASRLIAKAWAHQRPAKKPTTLREEQAWLAELRETGYDPATVQRPGTRCRSVSMTSACRRSPPAPWIVARRKRRHGRPTP